VLQRNIRFAAWLLIQRENSETALLQCSICLARLGRHPRLHFVHAGRNVKPRFGGPRAVP
jgi:hypothetical protein